MLESISTITNFRSFRALAALAVVALATCLMLLGAVAKPAQATMPGSKNGQILFNCQRAWLDNTWYEQSQDICVMSSDGSGQRWLLEDAPKWGDDRDAVWSPDGSKIAFVRSDVLGHNDYEIWVMNADGTGQTQITSDAEQDRMPTWSPDGKQIAFVHYKPGIADAEDRDIWVMNADGTGKKNLTNYAGGWDEDPKWSPDGQQIAFKAWRATDNWNDEIYVMNADGSGQTNITKHSARDIEPNWSPDGSKIAFTSNRDDAPYHDIYTMKPDGSEVTNLTQRPEVDDAGPSYSPDGKKIAYHGGYSASNAGGMIIHTMNADGTEQKPLLPCAIIAKDWRPDWGAGSTGFTGDFHGCVGASDTSSDSSSDATAPDAPTLKVGSSSTTTSTSGTTTSDDTPTFSGTAEPHSTVRIYDGGTDIENGGTLLGEARADTTSGNWEYTLTSPLSEGTHSITATATDTSGNTSGESAILEVKIDATAPTISVPQNLAPVEAQDSKGAVVNYEVSATDAVDGAVSVKCDPPSGSIFPIGQTTVTCTANDAAANPATATFTVTVQDKTAPLISGVPSDIKQTLTSTSGAIVNYTLPTANDAVDGAVSVKCEPASGSTFSIGQTTVTCTATDAAGNQATATFKVSILYGWNGFLQPINDTAHQTGVTQSKFKLGQTIPVKFEIKDAAGNSVQQATNPTFSRSSNLGACDKDATSEAAQQLSPDSGSAYEFTGGKYQYNWNTKGLTAGEYRIYANLADGTKPYVDICLTK